MPVNKKQFKLICIFLLVTIVGTTIKSYPIIPSFLVFGGKTGWIGQKVVDELKKSGYNVFCANSRLEDRKALTEEILKVKPDFIINAAGITGRPTVNWCENHKAETIRGNVLGAINLVDIAYTCNIHITNLTTGCIYQYDDLHTMYSGRGFTEEEEPNFNASFYSKTKILAEKIILQYPNVLNLRIKMPISSDLSPRGFVGKLISYNKLVNIPTSGTILEDLLPLIGKMCLKKLTGNYNFVNPGVISHNEVIELYKRYINPNHIYSNFSVEEHNELLKIPRSNCELSANKLLREFPDIPHIQKSIIHIFEKIAQQKQGDFYE